MSLIFHIVKKCTPLEFLDRYGFDNFKLAIQGLNDNTVKAYIGLAIDFYDFERVCTLSELISYYYKDRAEAVEPAILRAFLIKYEDSLKIKCDYETLKNNIYGVEKFSGRTYLMSLQQYMYANTFECQLTREELKIMQNPDITEEEVRLILMSRG